MEQMSKPPSFRFVNYVPPRRTVAEYSEAEKKLFKKQFQPAAESYRKGSRFFLIGFVSLFVLFLFFFVLGENQVISQKDAQLIGPWFVALLAILIFTALILAIKHDPICPACNNVVDRVLKAFCPECGASNLLSKTRCSSCGKRLSGGKGRQYTIRFCTHCGVLLDDKGI